MLSHAVSGVQALQRPLAHSVKALQPRPAPWTCCPKSPLVLPAAHAPRAQRGNTDAMVESTSGQSSELRQPRQSAKPVGQREAPSWILPSMLAVAGAGAMDPGLSGGGPFSTLQSMGVLALIVAVHEAGHFIAARAQGIHVSKFSIGFGPALFSTKGPDGIEYSLNAFPLGGYVAFPGDEVARPSPEAVGEQVQAMDEGAPADAPAEERQYDPEDPDLLKNRPIMQRAVVISAGVAANIVFALVTLFVQVSTVGKAESEFLPGAIVATVNESSAAARAGFQSKDIILRVNNQNVPATAEQVPGIVEAIKISHGQEMLFTVQRDGKMIELPCAPDVADNGDGRIGVQLSGNVKITHQVATDPMDALALTTSEFNRLFTSVYTGLSSLFTNFSKAFSQMTGPVAIVAAGSDILGRDAAGVYQFCAVININLALVNILPLPALDGGYMALLVVEAVRGGRRLSQHLEAAFMSSGMSMLVFAGAFIAMRDALHVALH